MQNLNPFAQKPAPAAPQGGGAAPAKPAKKSLLKPAPFVLEKNDLVQVIVATVVGVLGILTILKILDPLVFWSAYTLGIMICSGLFVIEWRSTIWEGLIYVLGWLPLLLFVLGMTPAFKAVAAIAAVAGTAEMALIALYQWPVAKWLEK